MKNKINIKNLYNLDIRDILNQYNNKMVLYKFLIYLIKDTQKYYDIAKNGKVYSYQNEVIRLLERLLAGELVPEKEIKDAAASNAADAAYYAAHATKKSVEAYKIDLISLILEEEGISKTNFELLYKTYEK